MDRGGPLDLSRAFLPTALAGLDLGVLDDVDRRLMNQIFASSYLHIFDLLETCLGDAARAQAMRDVDARDTLAPLLLLDSFDHNDLFRTFERTFERCFPVAPRLVSRPADLDEILDDAAPLSLLIIALHLKVLTQQHYLASVRGDEVLEPHFLQLLKDHWAVECGHARAVNPSFGRIQRSLHAALPGRVPAALRDYRRIVFILDDVMRRQASLDVSTFEAARGARLPHADALVSDQSAALRKTFITYGIVNAAFVYAMAPLGPAAPSMLASIVAALSARPFGR